jgi:4-amino-4-deoxy-L-arabinose transferase-like glycosyltransferase
VSKPAAPTPARARRRLRRVAPALFALLVFVSTGLAGERWIGLAPETGGSLHNLSLTWNLWRWGVASTRRGSPPELQPDNRREPLYSLLLAGVLSVSADRETTTRACLFRREPACQSLALRLKRTNVWILAATCAATFLAARAVLGPGLAAYAACLLFAATGSLWRVLDRAKSETLATLLVLLACWGLYAAVSRARWRTPAVAAGVALGLLMLTKAVFFFAGPVLLAATLLPVKGQRPWRPIGLALAIAYLVTAPWIARNLSHDLGFGISRDREVLAIRAEHTTMSWREWSAAWLYFAGEGSGLARSLLERSFAPQDWARLMESNPDGYYLRAKKNRGAVAARVADGAVTEDATYRAARSVILDHWPMQVAVTGPFAVRGIFVGQNLYRWPPARLVARTVANLMVPALAIWIGLLALRADSVRLWFVLLPAYSYAFHAGITQNIDRFSWPILPVAAVAFAALCALAASSVASRARGRPAA